MNRKIASIFIAATFAVLSPALAAACGGGEKAAKSQKKSIVETAVAAGQFNTLLKALTEADLVDTLSESGPFTVFAPSDQAFAKLPKSMLRKLLADRKLLATVLTYHVVAGEVTSEKVARMPKATAVSGEELTISTQDGVKIGKARITKADIHSSNGVIHVIDRVLMPPSLNLRELSQR